MQIDLKRQSLIEVFLHYNAQINLSAIRDADGVYLKHILDSLELLKVVKELGIMNYEGEVKNDKAAQQHRSKATLKIADIGTGGGFPLLPLAMSFPEVLFVGIDSVRKKLDAIEGIAKELGINNIELERARIEDMREKFDIVTARAVAHVEKLLPWTQGLLRKGSMLILYKELKQEEKEIMLKLLPLYNMKLAQEHIYSLFEGDIQRVIYILEKL